MLVEIKEKIGNKFVDFKLENIINHSILEFMCTTDKTIVLAIKENKDKILMIVSNKDEYIEKYKDNPCSMSCFDLNYVLTPNIKVVANSLKDSSLVKIERIKDGKH